MAKPFIKWAGGKGYLISHVSGMLNGIDLPYCEPMVGGGAIFFALRDYFKSHIIADVNPELINLYVVIRDNLDVLIAELGVGYEFVHKTDKASADNFHRIRASRPTDPIKRAARILFLLKTCFNGLMRVNKSGHFNVPMGSYTNPRIVDIEVLGNAAKALSGVDIRLANVSDTIASLASRHFLFVDPPYHGAAKFTGYSGEFGDAEQVALINQLSESEHKFIYTNRATELILDKLRTNSIDFELIPLKHSIQPKHTTGVIESEVVAFRL